MLRRSLQHTIRRSLSFYSPNPVCRFQVPDEKRILAPFVQSEFYNKRQDINNSIRVTDIFLKLEGVTANPFTKSNEIIAVPGMPEAIATLRKFGWRVSLYTHHTKQQADIVLDALSNQGIEFPRENIVTLSDLKSTDKPHLNLLVELKSRHKIKHIAGIISVFDDIPDIQAACQFTCWGIAQAGYGNLDYASAKKLNPHQLDIIQNQEVAKLHEHGPNFVTKHPANILEIAQYIDRRMKFHHEGPLDCLDKVEIPPIKRSVFISPF